jgi:hypothetical protein
MKSSWNLETQLKLFWTFLAAGGLVLYSRGTDNAENTVLLLRSADHTENTSHVIAKYCWVVTSLRLLRSVFTQPMPRSGLHNPVVPLLPACITYKLLFLWLNRSCMEQIRHNIKERTVFCGHP